MLLRYVKAMEEGFYVNKKTSINAKCFNCHCCVFPMVSGASAFVYQMTPMALSSANGSNSIFLQKSTS
ncbi:hypothetical protein, partial [Candidatus Kuenenia stuttgartiensis]|uniref:hypothetical protein n=1 Tax=Kuenenia stuttgartiensis TaxID=174633 RepID=UPI001B8D4C38